MAPIQTSSDRVHSTAAYLTFQLYRSSARSRHVPLEVEAPIVDVPPFPPPTGEAPLGGSATHAGEVPVVDAAATADPGGITVLAYTGTIDEPITATIMGLPAGAAGRPAGSKARTRLRATTSTPPSASASPKRPARPTNGGACTVELRPATVTALAFDEPGGSR
jgi:hypothetical protein